MALFRTDSIVVVCSRVEEAKRWWIEKFGCKQVKLPIWDNPLPSDVALKLPGDAEATVLLSDRAEVASAGLNRSGPVPIIFSEKVKRFVRNLDVIPAVAVSKKTTARSLGCALLRLRSVALRSG